MVATIPRLKDNECEKLDNAEKDEQRFPTNNCSAFRRLEEMAYLYMYL